MQENLFAYVFVCICKTDTGIQDDEEARLVWTIVITDKTLQIARPRLVVHPNRPACSMA
jgi:hypothetical protein